MKIRSGFVSNSSSSSFLIYGACFNCDELKELAKKVEVSTGDGDYDDDLYDLAEKISEAIGIDHEIGQDTDLIYFGTDATAIKDDETGKEFRDGIQKILTKAVDKEIKCGYHSEAWYNG